MRLLDILWFSRGRGRGHAVRDIAIARELRRTVPDLNITFASYATGYHALRAAGESVVDMNLHFNNPFVETNVRAAKLIRDLAPRLVVAQEEPAALSAAKIFDIPTLFETHWFSPPNHIGAQSLSHADHIIFTEEEGMFPEPPIVNGKVRYIGPIIKEFQFRPHQRFEIRNGLGLSARDFLILVLPGSFPELNSPIFDLVAQAFVHLDSERRNRLLWVAGDDYKLLAHKAKSYEDIVVVQFEPVVEKFMIASDLTITKGTYSVGREMTALGIPSISLSHRINYVDDFYSKAFKSNTFLDCSNTTFEQLADLIETICQRERPHPVESLLDCRGAEIAAKHIMQILTGVH